MTNGFIFDIKRFSIHDGPGIRSTVFLKGCALACQWCHNPESQSFNPELIFKSDRCLVCGDCIEACPHGAIDLVEKTIQQNWSFCRGDGSCAAVCFPGAREIIGREVTPEQVLDEVIRDRIFYQESGGGVTFSGGEPLGQPDFLLECLRLAKEAGLSTALDTSGATSWDQLERQLPYLDLILYDIKIMDDQKHQRYTGVSNQEVLENFSSLVHTDLDLIVRRPVIPDVNDSEEEIEDLAEFLAKQNGKIKIDLLPYHSLSSDKYRRLGREDAGEWKTPDEGLLDRIREQLTNKGFNVGLRG